MRHGYRYILDISSKKYPCPGCGKITLVRYTDTLTNNLLPIKYGRCDREINCTYHLNPYKDKYVEDDYDIPQKKPNSMPIYIPHDILKKTLDGYDQNFFLQNLLHRIPFPFEEKDIEKIIVLYYLGTIDSGYRKGAITFPYIDITGNIRAIQVKQFNKANHTTGTDFLHSILDKDCVKHNEQQPDWLKAYKTNSLKVSCLYGEHLLKKYPFNPIGLVEAPKTAIYGTLYFGFPDRPENLLWLAVYNLSSLTFEKCKALKGRTIFLFPDLSKDSKAYSIWSKKARVISEKLPGTFMKVSGLLEKYACEADRQNGLDIADILIEQDWRNFRNQLLHLGNTTAQGEKSENSEDPRITFFAENDPLIKESIGKSTSVTQILFPFI